MAVATGAEPANADEKQEVGGEPLTPEKVEKVVSDISKNPPMAFDIARKMRVFSSKIQFVEFKLKNVKVRERKIEFPKKLLDLLSISLDGQMSASFCPNKITSRIKILIKSISGHVQEKSVDDQWFLDESRRIRKEFLFNVASHGTVILRTKRKEFDSEIELLEKNLNTFYEAQQQQQQPSIIELGLIHRLVDTWLPVWKENAPRHMKNRCQTDADYKKSLYKELKGSIRFTSDKSSPPKVSVIYKDVSPESVDDVKFKESLEISMMNCDPPVDPAVKMSLFSTSDAAPAIKYSQK